MVHAFYRHIEDFEVFFCAQEAVIISYLKIDSYELKTLGQLRLLCKGGKRQGKEGKD